MTGPALAFLLATSAAAVPATMGSSQTLEALKAEAVRDPAVEPRSGDAARRAGQGFDGSLFHIKTLTPVGHVAPEAVRRADAPGPVLERPAASRAAAPAPSPTPAPGGPERSPTGRYYFEGKSPVNGITIYTAKPDLTGDGRTGAEGPDSPYAKYGTYGLAAGAVLAVAAFVVGGPAGIALGILAGVALGVGALISYLFKKK